MPLIIQQWQTPVDPGGGNPGRSYLSPLIGANWTNMRASFDWSAGPNWVGAFKVTGEANWWFNRFPQPPSPFLALDPQPAYVSNATDRMVWTTNDGIVGATNFIILQGDAAVPSEFCQYGTRVKAGFSGTQWITQASIETVLDHVAMPWWASLFFRLIGGSFLAETLCQQLPPQLPILTADTFNWSIEKVLQVWNAVAWDTYCECAPGATTPVSPPSPTQPQPPGFVPMPIPGCDNANLCGTVQAIATQVAVISGQLVRYGELITLLQRYTLPFEYVRGAKHSGISGKGSIQVSRLLGLGVHIALQAPPPKVLKGNPPYLWNQGWLSISNADGMVVEKRIAQDDFNWLPKDMPMATLVGWDLYPGCVVDITELQAET